MNRIHKLDLLKAAACIGVVFTHVTFPGVWGKAVMRAAGFAVHLWYLIAMAETYALWIFALKRGWQQKSEAMLPILLLLQFVLVIYCDSLDLPRAYQTNFLLRALPWFTLLINIAVSMMLDGIVRSTGKICIRKGRSQ